MRIFGSTLLVALALALGYVCARAATLPALASRGRRLALLGTGVSLWASFLVGRLLGGDGGGAVPALLELVGMHALAVSFLLALPLAAVDLLTGFGRLAPRKGPTLRAGAFLVGIALAAAALVQGTRPPAVSTHEVVLPGLPATLDGTVVAALSDFHLGSLLDGEWLEARVQQVEAIEPDVVLLLGDLLEGHGDPPGGFAAGLAAFSAPLGVWAVTGNHEHHRRGGLPGAELEQAGIGVLRDRWVEIHPGLVLAGVEDLTRRRRRGSVSGTVERALAGRPAGAAILLSHAPVLVEEAAAAGAGLMLSGHTHGGQIWPFGHLVRREFPHLAGRYEEGGMTLLVTRGAGSWGPRMRLWRPGEILRIVLRSPTARS